MRSSEPAADCAGLHDTFDTWANANTFPDQTDVLLYIDEALANAGCYS